MGAEAPNPSRLCAPKVGIGAEIECVRRGGGCRAADDGQSSRPAHPNGVLRPPAPSASDDGASELRLDASNGGEGDEPPSGAPDELLR